MDRTRNIRWAMVGSILCALLWPMTAAAQTTELPRRAETAETARGLSMGSGVRASAMSTSAVAYNPAALPFGRLYHLEGIVGYTAGEGRWTLGSTVVDSSTNKLAAGLSMRGLIGDGEEGYSGLDGRVALGFPLGNSLALGVGGRYVSLTNEAQAPEGGEATLARGFTVDAAIQLQPIESLRLAALGYNLVDVESALVPVLVGGSAALVLADVFTLGADVLVDLSTFEEAQILTGGGVEYLAGGQVPLRAGYRYDRGRHLHSLTLGVGYVDQKVGVDLSFTRDVRGGDATEFLAAVRYFVN